MNGRKDGSGGLSDRTSLQTYRILHRALEEAVRWQYLSRNPADGATAPAVRPVEMKVYSSEEATAIVKAADGSDVKLPILLAMLAGLRLGEIVGLKWSDVHKGRLTVARTVIRLVGESTPYVKQPKSGRTRTIPIAPELHAEMLRQRGWQAARKLEIGDAWWPGEWMCTYDNGEPLRPDYIYRKYQALARAAGVRVLRFHDLRHTFSTWMLEDGANIKLVSQWLGHSSTQITADVYSHVTSRMEAEAIQKLGRRLAK